MGVSLAEMIEFTGMSVALDRGTVAVSRPVPGGVELHFAGISGSEAFVTLEGELAELMERYPNVVALIPADLDSAESAEREVALSA